MEREGYRHATCYSAVKALRRLSRRVNIQDTEAVKTFLANVSWTESTKERMTNDLVRYYGYKNIPFDKPRYKRVETLPFIPLESEVLNLISGWQENHLFPTTNQRDRMQTRRSLEPEMDRH